MLGFNVSFVATIGSALDTTERGGKTRHSMRAAVRMLKPKGSDEYGTQWVTLNINEYSAEYARGILVGAPVVVFGSLRTSLSEDGTKTYFDVDVRDITAFPKRAGKEQVAAGGPDW